MNTGTWSASAGPQSARVFKEGYVFKLGGAKGGFQTWRERWMILKEEGLYYYKSYEEMVLLGVVPLVGDTQILEPPAWLDADECFECKTQFGLFKRKHHCRYARA